MEEQEFTEKQKIELVKIFLISNRKVDVFAQEHEVNASNMRFWVKKYKNLPEIKKEIRESALKSNLSYGKWSASQRKAKKRDLVRKFSKSNQSIQEFAEENKLREVYLREILNTHDKDGKLRQENKQYSKIPGKRQRNLEQKRLVEEFIASDLSAGSFVKKHKLNLERLSTALDIHDKDKSLRKQRMERLKNVKQPLSDNAIGSIEKFLKSDSSYQKFVEDNGLKRATLQVWLSRYDPSGEIRKERQKRIKSDRKKELAADYIDSNLTMSKYINQKKISLGTLVDALEKYAGGHHKYRYKNRFDEDYKLEQIKNYASSDLTKREFVERKEYSIATLSNWLSKLDPDFSLRRRKQTLRASESNEASLS